MKRTLIATVALSVAGLIVISASLLAAGMARPAAAAQESITGDWTGKVRETSRGGPVLWLSLMRREGRDDEKRGRFQTSFDVPLSNFAGLNPNAGGETQFSLQREAGAVAFTGLFRNGNGVGEFRFSPDGGFVTRMQNLGYNETLTTEKLFSLAVHDVGTNFISELKSLGYDRIPLDKLLAMRIHGADGDFIRRMKAVGVDGLPADKLIAMRIHGVDEQFIREVEAMGLGKQNVDKLISMRIHGVSREYVESVKALGYVDVSLDKLISMRIHGVSGEFVREMEAAGYSQISIDKLISMRIHGVNAQFAKEMRDAGHSNLTIDDLIRLRIHGVDGAYIRKMKRGN